MEDIKRLEELKSLIGENEKVVVKFGAEWCGPCKMMEKTLASLEEELPDVKFAHIDVEECDQEIVEEYSIMNLPTVILFKNGEVANRETGNIQKAAFKEKFGL